MRRRRRSEQTVSGALKTAEEGSAAEGGVVEVVEAAIAMLPGTLVLVDGAVACG